MQPNKVKISIIFLSLIAVFAGCFLFSSQTAQALGISPPWVKVPNLLRGSHFEKTVTIVQGDPKEPLQAQVQINVPEEIKNWITIKPGLEFVIPQVRQFPVAVVIDVPQDAKLGRYTGEIGITTSPAAKEGAQVTIGIGVIVELDLEVTEAESIDWSVPLQKIQPMEEGWPVKISFTIDNKGNGRARPKKVVLEAYREVRGGTLAGTAEDTDLPYVGAFTRGETIAEFPMNLTVGEYWAKITLYKNENEKLEYESPFQVLPKGTLPRPGKGLIFWFLIGIGVCAFCALMGGVIWLWRKFGKKILLILKVIVRPPITIRIEKKRKKPAKKIVKKLNT